MMCFACQMMAKAAAGGGIAIGGGRGSKTVGQQLKGLTGR